MKPLFPDNNSNKMINRKPFYLILTIVLIGYLLRLHNLGVPSLWLDEIWTVRRVNYPFLWETIKHLFYSPFPPLYYILMHIWVSFFGNSEFAVRFPSLFFSVLSIIYMYKLSKELFNENVGIIAALLLCVSSYSINYAQEAKMYSLIWFLGIVSFYYFYKFITRFDKRDFWLYITFTILMIYTMYIGFIFLLVQNIVFFLFSGREKIKKWVGGQLIIILSYLPWMHFFIFTLLHNRPDIHRIKKIDNYFHFFTEVFMTVTGNSIGKNNFMESSLYVLLIIIVLMESIRSRHLKQIPSPLLKYHLSFFWIIIPAVLYSLFDKLIAPVLRVRYVGFFHIPLIIIFARGIERLGQKIKPAILVFLLVVIISDHLLPYYKNSLKLNKEDYRAISNYLRHKKIEDRDLILTNFDYNILKYYYKEHTISSINFYCKEKCKVDKDYEHIYFIYRGPQPNQKFEDYLVKERYEAAGVGILVLQKS